MAEAAALDKLYSASTLLVGVNAKLVKEGVDEFAEVQGPDAPRASGRMSSAHKGARAICSATPCGRGNGRRDARDRAAWFDRRYLRDCQGGAGTCQCRLCLVAVRTCTAPGAEGGWVCTGSAGTCQEGI
jgi:hypothetical protein